MNYQYRLFYSWQSDNQNSRKCLRKMLATLVKQLKADNISVEIIEGGGGQGFVSIEDSVRLKIQKCDIFVGDVTPVGNVSLKSKLLPNANVMYEMGIATECMKADRIIAVAMLGDWQVENMPFDFNHYSMILFKDEKDLDPLKKRIKASIDITNLISKRNNERFFSDRLLNGNILSGKFLPETFLENRYAKDAARIFTMPYKMYQYIYESLLELNFNYYNRKRKQEGKESKFRLRVENWSIGGKIFDLDKLSENAIGLRQYLDNIVEKLNLEGNWGWVNSSKIKRKAERLALLNKRLMIVTSNAGGGKTNFVCDIVNNVLKSNDVPYIFVNAYELSSERLAESIAREYNFIGDGSLESVLLEAEHYCRQHLQYLIIVIDGLNEHPQQRLFQIYLVKVLDAVLNFRHIKVLMTCRKKFYDSNLFLLRQKFDGDLVEIELSKHRVNKSNLLDNELDCIFERYERYFEIKGNVHPAIRDDLSENLLLLRIFFEAYRGQDIQGMTIIDYSEIYERYYCQLCEKIEAIINQKVDIDVVKGIPTRIFEGVLEWMIANDKFTNIPYEALNMCFNEVERKSFVSFLNANLILQHDHIEEGALSQDVINFTYEEIRDFLLSRHLIEKVFVRDVGKFDELVEAYTKESNNLAEGLKRFLFLYARNKKKDDVVLCLKKRSWYENIYSEYIWDVKDECLMEEDADKVKELFVSVPLISIPKLVYYHWSPVRFKKVNINLFFDFLDNAKDKTSILESVWPNKKERKTYWGFQPETKRNQIVNSLAIGIDRRRHEGGNEIEIIALEKLKNYLVQYSYSKVHEVLIKNPQEKTYNIFGYDYYHYLMTVHSGSKSDFLNKAGVQKGFAKQFFGDLYDSVFAESTDVGNIYERYYSKEYKSLKDFISMHYSLPEKTSKHFVDSIKNGEYRLLDFSSIDYGNSSFENFFTSDEMMERMYNWFNWIEDEDKD